MPSNDQRLCALCQSIDIVALVARLEPYQTRTLPHHESYASLIKNAATCGLCAVLQASLFKDEIQRKSSLTSYDSEASSNPRDFLRRASSSILGLTRVDSPSSIVDDVGGWHEELDRRRGSNGFQLEVTAESTMDADFAVEYVVRYQRPMTTGSIVAGPIPRPLILSNDFNLGLGIRNRPVGDFANFDIYTKWIKDCAYGSKHVRCSKVQPVELPTRLLDVGTGAGSSLPKLAITAGMKGSYMTLSHCWGKQRLLVTTKENLEEHTRGIPFFNFPKMFRDAMLITKIMGLQYLWVDTLCIVQDDAADWENECIRMGDIYRNSVCTLAAPSAADSEIGMLSQRTPPALSPCRLPARHNGRDLGSVTIGPPPTDIKDHNSVLSSRAWVLQEQVLSPRTLCFGKNGMYFQCRSHEQLESYHHPLPAERVTSWRTSHASDLPKTLLSMAVNDVLYWYFIARQYSFRHLTYGDDKLPALAGLASYLSRETEDQYGNATQPALGEYRAGLWARDLGRGLLWTSDPVWRPSKTLHSLDRAIPSWSWASQNTPVEWRVLRDFRPDFETVACVMDLMTDHQFGRVRSGRLELNAPSKSALLQRPASTGGRNISISGVADVRELADVALDHTAHALFRDAAAWPESEPALPCRLLMLGKADSSLFGARWYALVLVAVRQQGRYRRVGVANSLGRGAAHARSLTEEQSYNWFGDACLENIIVV